MPKERTHLGLSEHRYQPFASSSSRYSGRSFSQNSFGQGCHPSSSGSSRYHGQSTFWNSPKSASPTVKDIKPAANNRKATDVKPAAEDMKEWDEIRCPVCMEHPHNAILLICASYHKGCRPFMCDTSYRHSNCFDQFRKSLRDEGQQLSGLSCPLCRGQVTRWSVLQPAREYMNGKVRSCSWETCQFSGGYEELRKHARRDHPDIRPSEADPERQQDWRRMEERQNFRDLLSTIQPGIGGHQLEFEVTDFVVEVSLGRRSLSAEPGEGTTIMHWWHDHGGAWQSQFFSDAEEDLELSSDFDLGLSDLD